MYSYYLKNFNIIFFLHLQTVYDFSKILRKAKKFNFVNY